MGNFLKKNWVEITFLIFFLFCVIALFYLEINAVGPVTERERGLFSALEFGLAIGIGWLFQRIASKEEFQRSLKQFALSAYRRINDIDKSVVRLDIEIERMRSSYPKEKMVELDLLKSITVVMNYTVQSSISDWSDIIGEEVRKKDRFEELQKEQQLLKSQLTLSTNDSSTNRRLEELRYEIDKLRSDIPYLLQDDLQNTRDMLPREGRLSEIVLSHFSTEIFAHSSVTLTISPFDVEEEGAFYNGPYWIVSEQSMSQLHAGIYNKDNIMIGVIENQFPEVFINDYIFTVLSLISVICGKTNSIDEMPLMHSRFVIGEATITKIPYGQKILFKIPATINVLARG